MLGIVLAAALGGPFPLLCTPYTEKGEVDCAVRRGLRRLAVAEEVWRRSARSADPTGKMTALVRMVDDAKTDEQYRLQYETVAAKVKHPVIIQTYNGIGPMPSMKLMIELAKRYPDVYGWFKVEGSDRIISDKMASRRRTAAGRSRT